MNKVKEAVIKEFAHIVLRVKSESYRKNYRTKIMVENRIIEELQARKWCHERQLPYDETLIKQDVYLVEQLRLMMEFEVQEKLKEWGYKL